MDATVREMNTAQINNKFVEINKLDENLKSTMEREEDHSLVHLDMIIIHDKESGKLSSTLGSDRNFGSVRQKFCRIFSIQFHAHLECTGIKRTDYAILCNKSFSQSQHNATLHISTITFYVLKTFGLLRGRILYSYLDFIYRKSA